MLFQGTPQYQIPEDIQVICLHKKGWWNYPVLIWKVSRLYRRLKPDVVLSALTYTNVICVLSKIFAGTRLRLILSEHGMPSFPLSQTKNPVTILFLKWVPRWVYNRADKIVCVSKNSADEVNKIFKVPAAKIEVIYNPIDIENITALCKENIEHPWFAQNTPIIVSAGRLIDIKGYPCLIRSFKQILTSYPSKLVILGQGEKEESLKHLAFELGIDESVAFLGFQNNPFKYMARSNVFVLASLTEAFPMVVLEAMACGVPVVSTSSPGSGEIITNRINGLLVPVADEKALSEAIALLLTDKTLANNLAQSGKKRVNDFYFTQIIKKYEELFREDSHN